jgi:hypothetical protein
MKFRGGEFSTGTTGNFQPELTEKARLEAAGEWTPEVEEKFGAKLLCGTCYDYAKSFWSSGRKITQ